MKIFKKIFLYLIVIITETAFAQSGCTDYQAVNYDPAAVADDGSCIYPNTVLPLTFKCYIDSLQLNETSGIVNQDKNFWTHIDDSNNSIYRIDTLTDSIFQKVTIANATNIDWEDITSDSNYIYVGDVGNNDGNRTNLRFYRVLKSDITPSTLSVNAGRINFSYSDQVNFTVNHNHNFYDCEAFFYTNDSIHIFTKGWVNKWTKHYVLPADTGTMVAQLVDSFNVGGYITSAAIQGDSLVVLLGIDYSANGCFIWMFNKFNGSHFFNGNKRRLYIDSPYYAGQTEGICFTDTNKGYITNERLSIAQFYVPAQLREFDLNSFLAPEPEVPIIDVSSDTISRNLRACYDTVSASATIRNVTPAAGQDLIYSLSGFPVWLSATPLSDTIAPGDSSVIIFNFNSALRPAGNYHANISIQSNDIYHSVKNVHVMLSVDSNPCMVFNTRTSICTGQTTFSTLGLNHPTSYFWDFGDGDTSTAVNPVHTYTSDGNFTITLIGCNSSGCDTTSNTVDVHISGPMVPACQTTTQSYCCGIGIKSFQFSGPMVTGFGSFTQDASVGYEDFTCSFTNTLMTNYPYNFRCTTGSSQPEYLKVWLDMNNDGVFDTLTEELYSDFDTIPPIHNGTITIPTLPGNVYGIPIRLRLASDYQQVPQPCLNPVYGQQEDYAIILNFSVGINEPSGENNFMVFPNPFLQSTAIDFSLKQTSDVKLSVYNITGEKAATLADSGAQPAGQYHYEFSQIPAGIYFIRLTVNDVSLVKRIIKME